MWRRRRQAYALLTLRNTRRQRERQLARLHTVRATEEEEEQQQHQEEEELHCKNNVKTDRHE